MSSLEAAIAPEARILLDTSVMIAYLTAGEVVSPVAREIIDGFIASERNDSVLSTLALGELLVWPHRAGTAREVAFDIMETPGVTLRSVDFLIAAEAARMRAESSLRLPDAIVLATGVLAGATCLVTNDRRLAAAAPALAPSLRVCLLSDHVASTT